MGLVEVGTAIVLTIIMIILLASSIRIVPEYQRLVKLRLGKYVGTFGPGVVIVIPIIDRVLSVDLRVTAVDLPAQKALTKDNVEVSIDAAVYFRVIDPEKSVLSVVNYKSATALLASSTLRDVVGMIDLDTLLTQREEVAKKIASVIDEQVCAWGIKVTSVVIKDIKLPETLIRAMAQAAEAERTRRAKVILAQADYEASQLYLKAAETYTKNNVSILLRQIDALIEIARERNLVIVVPSTLELATLSTLALPAVRSKLESEEKK